MLSKTLLLPAAVYIAAHLAWRLAQHTWDLLHGRHKTAFKIDAGRTFILLQALWWFAVAAMVMRLKLFWTTQLILLASMVCDRMLLESISSLRPLWASAAPKLRHLAVVALLFSCRCHPDLLLFRLRLIIFLLTRFLHFVDAIFFSILSFSSLYLSLCFFFFFISSSFCFFLLLVCLFLFFFHLFSLSCCCVHSYLTVYRSLYLA